ncbi:MAG: ComEC/Rec2 family competence protein [Candidatus Paceibacterota bacterium]
MSRADTFFVITGSFLLGAILAGLGLAPVDLLFYLALIISVMTVFRYRLVVIGLVVVFILVGNFYYAVFDRLYYAFRPPAETVYFVGRIIDSPSHQPDRQRAKVELHYLTLEADNHQPETDSLPLGKVFIYAEPYPRLSYGDIVAGHGRIIPPPNDSFGRYLAKEKIGGAIFYPEMEIVGRQKNFILARLYDFKGQWQSSLEATFTPRQAAFLAGILLGDRDGLTDDFREQLSASGTIHLTALSGLHMAILIFVLLTVLNGFLPGRRRLALAVAFLIVGLFVAMTGFKVSAIRSSLMAGLAGSSGHLGRVYDPRNAILLAALIITLANPKAPTFDLGFQLSFLATLAIIYLAPAIKRLTFFRSSGFLHWREILAVTTAAQLGVAPIIIANFASFSLTAWPANLVVLIIMPAMMMLGLAAVLAGLVFAPLATVIAWPTAWLVDEAMTVIGLFAYRPLYFNPEVGIGTALLYYGVIIFICAKWSPKVQNFLPTGLRRGMANQGFSDS